jgi:hypothetical protein
VQIKNIQSNPTTGGDISLIQDLMSRAITIGMLWIGTGLNPGEALLEIIWVYMVTIMIPVILHHTATPGFLIKHHPLKTTY